MNRDWHHPYLPCKLDNPIKCLLILSGVSHDLTYVGILPIPPVAVFLAIFAAVPLVVVRVRACWRRPLVLQSDPGFAGRQSALNQGAAVIVAPPAPPSSRPSCLRGLACPVAQSKRYCRKSGVCRTPQPVSAPRGFANIGSRVRLLANACSLRRRRVAPLSRERLDRDRGENFAAPSPGQFQ